MRKYKYIIISERHPKWSYTLTAGAVTLYVLSNLSLGDALFDPNDFQMKMTNNDS